MENFISNTSDDAISPQAENQITIEWTQFSDKFAKSKKQYQMTWPEVMAYLTNAPTYPTKPAMPLLKLATFGDIKTDAESFRSDKNVLTVYGVEGDYDAGVVTIEEAAAMIAKRGIEAFLYSSPSATPDLHKWRVLAAFMTSKEPEERLEHLAMLNGALGGILAPESFTLSQSYYYGKAKNAEYKTIHVQGETIDLKTGQWNPEFKNNVVEVKNATGEVVGERSDIVQLSNNIANGIEIHNSTRDLAAHLAATGVRKSTALAMLQGLMSTNIIKDDRWTERYNDLENLVTSAFLKFSKGEFALDANGAVVKSEPYALDIVQPSTVIKSQEFILNRLISGGLVVLAAAPGGGKTTALVALAMRAAGFIKDGLAPELVRKVVFFTEHSTQVEEIITAMVASGACPVDYETVREYLIIVNAKRLSFDNVKNCAEFIDKNDYSTMNYKNGKSYSAKPLVIFDTTNANFDLENENDSQVVGRFMAEIKTKFYVDRGIHVLLSGHTSKALKHGDAESMSARGSGAYEGDAYQVVYITVSGNDRYLEIGGPKHRFHAVADSIKLISASALIKALDVFDDEVSYPVTYIQDLEYLTKEEKDSAKAKAKEEKAASDKVNKENNIRGEILDLMKSWPSLLQAKSDAVIPTKRAIQDRCSGDTGRIGKIFDQLVAEGHILGFDISLDNRTAIKEILGKPPHGNQTTYYWQRIRDDQFM